MSWDSVSDFEINKAVKKLEKEKRLVECKAWAIKNGNTEDEAEFFCNPPDNVYSIQIPDYCNSWADMGSIIIDQGISLIKWCEPDEGYEASIVNYYGHGSVSSDIFYSHIGPLRAAAIVYLMMNGIGWEDLV